jgi:hypothetical protein
MGCAEPDGREMLGYLFLVFGINERCPVEKAANGIV